MTFPLDGYDAIHASPPCQKYSPLNARCGYKHTIDLVAAVRERLEASGVPWVIENVMGAPLRGGVVLCGGMFGLRTYRHRRFESSLLMFQPYHPAHVIRTSTKNRVADLALGLHISVTGNVGVHVGVPCMGINWMNGDELSQAVPPAYTEWIGTRLLPVSALVHTTVGPAISGCTAERIPHMSLSLQQRKEVNK